MRALLLVPLAAAASCSDGHGVADARSIPSDASLDAVDGRTQDRREPPDDTGVDRDSAVTDASFDTISADASADTSRDHELADASVDASDGGAAPDDASSTSDARAEGGGNGDAIDCRDPTARASVRKNERWLAFRGKLPAETYYSAYLVRITPSGMGPAHRLSTVGTDWNVGAWSADGRFFAYSAGGDATGATLPRGAFVVELDETTGPASTTVNETGWFWSWSPVGSLFAVRATQNTLWIKDATKLDEAHRALGLGRMIFSFSTWSPDGRYLALYGDSNVPGLFLVDVTAARLTLTTVATQATARPAWSADGRYMAYTRSTGDGSELFAVDMRDAGFVEQRVAMPVENQGSIDSYQWFDSHTLAWSVNDSKTLYTADLSAKPWRVTTPETPVKQLVPSPGGRCLAYRGICGDPPAPGTCLRSLPPDGRKPALRITGTNFHLAWSADGSLLAVTPQSGQGIWVLPTRGEAPRMLDVHAGTHVNQSGEWSPTVPPQWLSYTAAAAGGYDYTLRLWSAATKMTDEIVTPGLSQSGGVFSPDGTYYALLTSERNFPARRVPLLVQHLDSTRPLEQWELAGVQVNPHSFAQYNLIWQP